MLKPWFRFRFKLLVFHMVIAFFKVYAFQNCKLIKPLHKGMAETDISHEFGREPGFSSSVFCSF